MTVDELKKIIEDRRASLGLTMAQVNELAFPGKAATVVQNIKRGRAPSLDTLDQLCKALNLDFHIGPKRDLPDPTELTVNGEDFETVPRYEAQAAAGGGVWNDDAKPVGYLAFSRDWLRRNHIVAGNCMLIEAMGDSMEPSIQCGDLLMLDRRQRAVGKGKRVYVFRCPEDGLKVKRLELIDGKAIAVLSDNPSHQTQFATGAEMQAIMDGILGLVVWSGHVWAYP